jgi:hypothetical protein
VPLAPNPSRPSARSMSASATTWRRY